MPQRLAVGIEAAAGALKAADKKDDPRSRWLQNLSSRRNKNIAAVALANKNARIAWALLSKATDYLPEGEPALAKPHYSAVL